MPHEGSGQSRRAGMARSELNMTYTRISGSSQAASVATIEVDPRVRAIVQARGLRNRAVSIRARQLISMWARRENLELRC